MQDHITLQRIYDIATGQFNDAGAEEIRLIAENFLGIYTTLEVMRPLVAAAMQAAEDGLVQSPSLMAAIDQYKSARGG